MLEEGVFNLKNVKFLVNAIDLVSQLADTEFKVEALFNDLTKRDGNMG